MKRIFSPREGRIQRHHKIRARVEGTAQRPRLVVHRSNTSIEAQLIDDGESRTLIGFVDRKLSSTAPHVLPDVPSLWQSKRLSSAYQLGWVVAQRAKEQGVTQAVFDRAGYRYHGRVRAVAEGARAAGLRL